MKRAKNRFSVTQGISKHSQHPLLMRFHFTKSWRVGLALLALCASSVTLVNAVQLASVADASFVPPAGGGGDSVAPVLSPDGRYVLFTSTANNLALTTTSTPYRAASLPRLNVFLRDCTNGTTMLASVNRSGRGGGNGDSIGTEISTNGQYALFESSASDLVPDDTNNCNDVFWRNLITDTTHLVSVSTNGSAANGASRESVMAPEGRYVAFVSVASNLVPNDTNAIADVFVADLQSNTITLVSVGAMPTNSASSSQTPDITPDGRYVAFYSTATNLVPGVTTAGDIYVRDLVGGITYWASANARTELQTAMGTANATLSSHTISKDGKFVAFRASPASGSTMTAGIILRYSLDTGLTQVVNTNANVVVATASEETRNLDMTPDGRFIAFVGNTNGTTGTKTCIYVWDALTGVTTLASGDLSDAITADSICGWPTIDPTSRFVAFLSSGTNNLVTNSPLNAYHLYVRDMQAGTTKLINKATNGVPQGVSFTSLSRLAAGGQYIAFEAPDGNLVPGDVNRSEDVFLHDLVTGTTTLASAREPSLPALTPIGSSGGTGLSVSGDGRYVAFASSADNVVANDTNKCTDIFVRDVVAGVSYLVSVNTNGMTANTNNSTEASISADGRYVAFSSIANNLVAGDANGARDVFLRDLLTATTTLVSVRTNSPGFTNSGSGSAESYLPVINADGQRVLFSSLANNLAPVVSGSTNLFYRNLQAGTTRALTIATNGVSLFSLGSPVSASMTPDGRWVAFITSALKLYVWDSQSATRVYTNGVSTLSTVNISPDGSRLAYTTNGQLYVTDWPTRTTWLVGAMPSASRAGLHFSADGRFLTYASKTAQALVDINGTYDVYLYDVQTQTKLLVSQSYAFPQAANAASDSPDISPDGRLVTYRSDASDLVPSDSNAVSDIFLFDRLAGNTTLLSASRFGGGPADSWSFSPRFTSDGRQAVFQSWASDLAGFDFNQGGDVFAYPMFYADIMPGVLPAQVPTLSWPAVAGKTYHVEFLDDASLTNWQNAGGIVTIVGEQAYFTDPAPGAGQRFYRIVAD